MSTVLVVAAHGYGNVGDDICAHSGSFLAKQIDPKNKTIITSPPFSGRLVRKSDAVILSGGGIIYDRSAENVENYLAYLRAAQKADKPTAVLGVGVQGIVTDWGKESYKEVLNKVSVVSTRSISDKRLLANVGVEDATATQDLGFLADDWIRQPRIKSRLKHSSKPKLALILMDVRILQAYKKGDNEKLKRYISIVEENIAQLAEQFDIWLFAHSRDDENWRNQMARKHNLKTVPYQTIKDLPKFFYLYKQMDLVVGVRFHSVILGLLAQKPVVGIGSKFAKLARLVKEAPGLREQSFSIGDTEQLEKLFKNLRARYDAGEFKTLPKDQLKALKEKAWQNKALLKQALS